MTKKILLFLLIFPVSLLVYGESGMKLKNLSVMDGLSNMNVSSIVQDSLGYIWIATMNGLNRYNGAEFTHYFNNPKDTNTLSSSHLNEMLIDDRGNLYIGSSNGINIFNLKTEKFSSPFPNLKKVNINSLAQKNGYIYAGADDAVYRFRQGNETTEKLGLNWPSTLILNCIFFDKSGRLWCCLDNDKGIACYNNKNNTFDFFRNSGTGVLPSKNSVKSAYQYSDDLLILCTKNGIDFFDMVQQRYVNPPEFSGLTKSLEGNEIEFIKEHDPQVYWIGTYRTGIYVFDKAKNKLTRHYLKDGISEVHSNSYINYYTDREGNEWLATFDAGLDIAFREAKNFNFDPFLNQITQNRFITGISEDKASRLVIATKEDGFFVYDPVTKKQESFTPLNSGLNYPYIRSIFVDSQNHYWIGYHYGLQLFYPTEKKFITLPVPEPNNGVVSLLETGGVILAGTDRQGLIIFDLNGNLIRQITEIGLNITKIIRLTDDEVLLNSFGNGIFRMNTHTFQVDKLTILNDGAAKGYDQSVTLSCTDGEHLWMGTYSYGLILFNLRTGETKNFSVSDGLPSNDVVAIEDDGNSHLWLSTSYGLVLFSLQDYTIRTFLMNEGINNLQFHEKSSLRDHKGTLYFGGNFGITYFSPNDIKKVDNLPFRVILEKLYIQNSPVSPESGSGALSAALPYTRKITLGHRDKIITIDYVAFNYLSAEAVDYFYMLEGFDKGWYEVGKQRKVSYSNLSRGDYLFKVKAKNGAGVWSENHAELKISVKPAPWFSYTAWFCYAILVMGIIFLIFRIRLKTVVIKKELDIEHYEHQREREIHSMKQRFFSNISHELRTPLTMISVMVNQLSKQEKLTPQVRQYTQNLELSLNRLLKLVNQLLAFRKLESEAPTLWLEYGCINEALHTIINPFVLFAREKNIRIEIIENNNYQLWFDVDKLEKIMSNLLSNAVKHTGTGGEIRVEIHDISPSLVPDLYPDYQASLQKKPCFFIEILVTDTGSGIEEKYWKTIFDRYRTVDSGESQKPDYSSSGIGLHFTRSLVELHKGAIRVTSKTGTGSTFAILLPTDPDVFQKEDFAGEKENNPVEEKETVSFTPPDRTEHPDPVKSILLAEDDPELNKYLSQALGEYYEVFTCFNGEVALHQILKKLPDIVLSDVMMPGISGFELTRRIKENPEICHIPVILLTAKTETASQIEGLSYGADAYIPKPFEVDYLLAVIESQLKNRQRIQEIFLNGKMPPLQRNEVGQLDVRFLSKFNTILEKELANPNLDISQLANSLNMSRSSFYRKFLILTSISPVSYIRKYRINKSIELMATGKYSLAEISEMSGFSSPSYFSTAFRQEQNISPTDYINKNKSKA